MCSTNLCDDSLAEKFKREYAEQFHILVRMHLSFLLDLPTDETDCVSEKGKVKKWNMGPTFGKKSKNRGVTEGAPLTQEGICQVYQLIEFLKKEQNIKVEGIFRRTGSIERQQELRNILGQGVTLHLEGAAYSVHDCASVLKGFLAELPDPLLTEAHFSVYCQIAEMCGITDSTTQDSKLLEALQLILLLLPSENKVLLRDILDLLHLTATYEESNRMSAENLAKLFTPHLLWPRKLSPEHLLTNSQSLFGIVSFMITNSEEIFKIPPKLTMEFRARYEKSQQLLNESSADTANTVFTFIDHERTAKENEANPTDTALAQLYAHIQGMPESSKKRKLVKQFNKENGHGTPLQVIRSSMPKNKSFGDSIKKHIFYKGLVKSVKKSTLNHLRSSSEEILNSPQQSQQQGIISKARLFCANCDSSTDLSNDGEVAAKKQKILTSSSSDLLNICEGQRSRSEPDLTEDSISVGCSSNLYMTSTPACLPLKACPTVIFTPDGQDRKSMSPITRSTQRMTRAMQETMMTPRSRKPVLLLSGTNINDLPKIEPNHQSTLEYLTEESSEQTLEESTSAGFSKTVKIKKNKSEGDLQADPKLLSAAYEKINKTDTSASLSNTFREYLSNRDILTLSPVADSSFSSRTDDYDSTNLQDLSDSKMTDSLLYCLNGNNPEDDDVGEKELVLKPKQFDENGKPIVFETSF